jgi:hypothetical protein
MAGLLIIVLIAFSCGIGVGLFMEENDLLLIMCTKIISHQIKAYKIQMKIFNRYCIIRWYLVKKYNRLKWNKIFEKWQ